METNESSFAIANHWCNATFRLKNKFVSFIGPLTDNEIQLKSRKAHYNNIFRRCFVLRYRFTQKPLLLSDNCQNKISAHSIVRFTSFVIAFHSENTRKPDSSNFVIHCIANIKLLVAQTKWAWKRKGERRDKMRSWWFSLKICSYFPVI